MDRELKINKESEAALRKITDLNRSSNPANEKNIKLAIRTLSNDLARHLCIDPKDINQVHYRLLSRQMDFGKTTNSEAANLDPVTTEVFLTSCTGCTCHYGVCSIDSMTCEYIGSAVEESCVG